VLVVDPALPPWLPEVTIRNIQVGASVAALRFRREASGSTKVDVLANDGLHIIRPAAPIIRGSDRVPALLDAVLNAADAGLSVIPGSRPPRT
jgi:hypothetical protein